MGKTIVGNDQALASDILTILGYGLSGNIPAAATVLVDSLYYETDTKILKQEQAGAWAEIARGETATRLAQLAERGFASLTGRATKSQMEWTAAKLLLGAGAGADPTEISVPSSPTSGSYAGNSTENRAIPHGLGVIPKIVFIQNATNHVGAWIVTGHAHYQRLNVDTTYATNDPDITNIYVGDTESTAEVGNETGRTYYWVAIG